MNPSYAYTNDSPSGPPGVSTPTVANKSTPPRLRRRGFTIGADDDEDSGSGERERDGFISISVGAGGGSGGAPNRAKSKERNKDNEKDGRQTCPRPSAMPTITATTMTTGRKQRRRGRSLRKTALLRPGKPTFDPPLQNGVVPDTGGAVPVPVLPMINGNGTLSSRRSNSPGLKLSPAVMPVGAAAGPSSAIYDSADDSEGGGAYRGGGGVAGRIRGYPVRGRSGSVVMVMPKTRQEEIDSAADTVYWGWVVLCATWIVFVVGMGSVLGVWEWAWDVPGSPFAKTEKVQESEGDDKGAFPIDGYYPALIILMCIMAWVWVVVAWIGMKYFKHAKIQPPSEDFVSINV